MSGLLQKYPPIVTAYKDAHDALCGFQPWDDSRYGFSNSAPASAVYWDYAYFELESGGGDKFLFDYPINGFLYGVGLYGKNAYSYYLRTDAAGAAVISCIGAGQHYAKFKMAGDAAISVTTVGQFRPLYPLAGAALISCIGTGQHYAKFKMAGDAAISVVGAGDLFAAPLHELGGDVVISILGEANVNTTLVFAGDAEIGVLADLSINAYFGPFWVPGEPETELWEEQDHGSTIWTKKVEDIGLWSSSSPAETTWTKKVEDNALWDTINPNG